ncbi:Gfo/Idh/MocA family oxidoreductase [Streptomyces sp. NBS 14/10]|uniref:Gfo/Idh/MocA family protein n=1 Tax=Streptomyces sp. NBS 14/10 TaxID=1945643 RepID=UPI000B7C65DE|nr:Gfo/Idh/MocA family oxidoreductase [Streptomyces sp. NBS 14/10]KAK1184390.1 Gfo/Idh/MocA family oxidoreductase [Streptomyces sp. NBS 14/10]
MTSGILRIGLVGCGAIAELGHATALRSLSQDCAVVAVVDPMAKRRDLLGSLLSVPVSGRFRDVSELLSRGPEIDLAVVALPPAHTVSVVTQLLQAGLRVLSEKPLAGEAAAARAVGRGVPESRLGVIHNYRYRSDILRAKALLAQGMIGAPRFLRLERPDTDHFPGRGIDPEWRRKTGPNAGCLLDNAYHWVYLAEELANAPTRAVTARLSAPGNGMANDLALLTLDHSNGALTSIQSAWCAVASSPVLEVHGDTGSLRMTGDCGTCIVTTPTSDTDNSETDTEPSEPAYTAMYRDVLVSVRASRPFGASVGECADVLSVIEAAVLSAAQGRTVVIDRCNASRATGDS